MKFTRHNIIDTIKKKQIKALLLFGPDSGMASILVRDISSALGVTKDFYDYEEIDISSLYSLLKTKDLFGEDQVIHIKNVPNSIEPGIKNLLAGNLVKFAIFSASELPKSSSMRKFFETENELGVIPCYLEEPYIIVKNIKSQIAKANKTITDDALSILASINGDSLYIENEVEKLITYCSDKQKISYNDVQAIMGSDIFSSPDKLCNAFASGDRKAYLYELAKLLEDNISEIWIIRAIIRYYLNMYYVISKISKENINIEAATNLVNPPIFFKNVPSFKKNVTSTDITKVKKILSYLQMIEKNLKTGLANKNNMLESLCIYNI